jgi:hypothetical protein
MRNVNHLASMILVQSQKTNDFLFGGYNSTYPKKCFRNTVNFIGGVCEDLVDDSPLDTLIRELREEFSINKNVDLIYASEKDISIIRESIITNILPFKDYLVSFPSVEGGQPFSSIHCVFHALIPEDIFEIARTNINENKKIKNEGIERVCSLKDLEIGKVKMAWASGLITGDYCRTDIPNYKGLDIEIIGTPRKSFEYYKGDFIYTKNVDPLRN